MFMKRILILISLVFICLTAFSQTEKAAVLMVHFGTSEAEGRALSLDAVNRDVKAAFPELEVRQAYASGIIRKKLEKDTGIARSLDAIVCRRLPAGLCAEFHPDGRHRDVEYP